MNFWENISKGFKQTFDKRRDEREQLQRLQREADQLRSAAFEEEFRRDSLEAARMRARTDARKLSGLAKLQALDRSTRLNEPSNSFFNKLAVRTQKNLQKRDENLKRTELLRAEAKKMRDERMMKITNERAGRMAKVQERNKGGLY